MALERITQKTIDRFAALARDGLSKVESLTDPQTEGLVIWAQGRSATWQVRAKVDGKSRMVKVGTIWPHSDPWNIGLSEARDIGRQVRVMLIAGDDPREYIKIWHSRRDHDAVKEAIAQRKAAAEPTWTFGKVLDNYVDHKTKTGRIKGGAILAPKAKTIADIRSVFSRPAVLPLRDKPARLVSRGDLERIRDEIGTTSGQSTSNKLVTYARAAMDLACRFDSGASGLDGETWWRSLAARYTIQARTRKPTVEDMVRTLILAEQYVDMPLPGRSIAKAGVRPGTLAAIWWLALTAQRAGSGLELMRGHIVPDPTDDAWCIASWEPDTMKGGRLHLLPIPARAVRHVEHIRSLPPLDPNPKSLDSSHWMFPSEKTAEKRVTESGVYRTLVRLAGKDELKGPSAQNHVSRVHRRSSRGYGAAQVDLLGANDIAWWSPHDIRRSLTKFMNDIGIPGGASFILAHVVDDEDRNDRELPIEQRVQRVTSENYGRAQFLNIKKTSMTAWVDRVLDAYEAIKAEWEPVTEWEKIPMEFKKLPHISSVL